MNLLKREKCDIDEIEKDIEERDHRDMTRETRAFEAGRGCGTC